MPWPDYWQLKTVQNRETLLSLAKDLNIPIPKYSTMNEAQRFVSETEGPWVIKPGYSMMVKGNKVTVGKIRYALNATDLDRVIKEMRIQGLNPIVQEFIPGEDGFFVLYNKGEIRASFQHHRLREAHYMGGASSLRESVNIPELEREGKKIPQKVRCHGPIMVEFRRDKRDSKFKLMEVNPRFWGSLNLAIQ